MIKTTGVYHTSIPADDIERAERFYTEVLGMQLDARVGGEGSRIVRLHCGAETVVLFQRPQPLGRDSHKEDGVYHQSFEMDIDAFDDAVESMKKLGNFDRITERDSGRTLYYWDTEGNYQELHASRPQS